MPGSFGASKISQIVSAPRSERHIDRPAAPRPARHECNDSQTTGLARTAVHVVPLGRRKTLSDSCTTVYSCCHGHTTRATQDSLLVGSASTDWVWRLLLMSSCFIHNHQSRSSDWSHGVPWRRPWRRLWLASAASAPLVRVSPSHNTS